MKIKNIQEFRKYWKEKENFSGFDENFIGAKYNDINGFYRIVNGTVYDIKADLTPKLQNAQDEQAIYEFLQNAADSNSNNCAIIYDEDYFMVLNNGEPFSIKDVEAILNSFQGTKADKSQKENCEKIGRYGIGFKLVHRLVGKSDGAKELIENMSGPVVFSWFKESQLKSLFDYQINQNLYVANHIDNEESSWLFKIALTCFPTMPKEKVKNLNYEETIIYNNEELLELVKFLNKHKTKIDNLNLKNGSLFFLKFGENKHQKLEESFKNINSGIGYSLNTLKTLDTVVLQDNLVERIDIERIDFKIQVFDAAFKKIDPEFPDCPIDIMFGYRTDDYEALKTAPNIYQFFPMRNETHGLSFFIHASSFAKVTDRTKLDDQGESNIHTLSFLSNELQNRLESDIQINEKEKARNIFKSIIFSKISERQTSELVVNNLLKPLIQYFKNNIPTVNGEFHPNENVLIKATKLKIIPSDFGIDKDWIFWSDENFNKNLTKEIKEKLGVKKWNIDKLIENGTTSKINRWITELENEQYLLFLKELDKHIPKGNFEDVEFIKCSDDNFYSISDLKNNKEVIVVFDKISKIRNILIELDFTISIVNISEFPVLKSELAKSILYLSETQEVKLFEDYIYTSTSENELSPLQKRDLFICMKGLHGVGQTLLSEFKLFCNSQNEIKPLNQLIDSKLSIPSFLEDYTILDSENIFSEIRKTEFLRNNDTIYGSIIYSNWDKIIEKSEFSSSNIASFYEKVSNYYKQANTEVSSLNEHDYIFTGDSFEANDNVFYHSKFIECLQYNNLSNAIEILTGYRTPDKTIVKYLKEKPFKTSNDNFEEHLQSNEIDIDDAKAFINFSKEIGVSIFKYGYFENYNSVLFFNYDDEVKQYYSKNENLNSFIKENLSHSFHLIPNKLIEYRKDILRNGDLQQEILNKLDGEINEHIEILVELLTGENFDNLINETEEIHIRFKHNYSEEDFEYKLFNKIKNNQIDVLKDKLVIEYDTGEFNLNEATFTSKVSFEDKYTLDLSKVLPKSKLFQNASIISKVSESFIKVGIPESKISEVFHIDDEIDDQLYKQILEELLDTESSLMKDENQLAFVLLYNQYIENIDLSNIEAYHINNEKYAINYSLYINKFSFISESETLDERYWEIGKLLKLNKSNPIFKADNSACNILLKPYFDKEEQIFICDNIKSDLEISDKKALLNFIFDYWEKFNENKRTIKSIDWSTIGKTNTIDILGFNPAKTIWDNKLALDEEKCPIWLKRWGSRDDYRLSFLSDLGIITETSIIHKIRLGLSSNYVFEDQLRIKSDNEEELLEASFDWIIEKELKFKNEKRFKLLKRIADRLEIEFDTSLNEEKLENNSIPFDEVFEVDYYKDWSKEFGYSIYFYNGEMPYDIQYNDYTLKETSEGNIEMINETIFLNKEYFKTEKDLIKINSKDELLPDEAYTKLLESIIGSLVPENSKPFGEIEPEDGDVIPPGTGLSPDERKRRALEYKRMVKQYLSEHGFDVTNWSENYAHVTGIIDPQGNLIEILIKGAKGGKLFIHPIEWLVLSKPNSKLIVINSNNSIVNVPFEGLMEPGSHFHLQFRTETFSKKGIFEFAKVFQYVSDCKFIIDSPRFSYFDFMENFGLSEKQTGEISGKTDDDF